MIPLTKFFRDNPEWRPYADLVAAPLDGTELRAEFPDADIEVLDRCLEYVSHHGYALARGTIYVKMRREQASDRWAAMCALQQAPRIMTDSVFFEGFKRPGDEFDPHYAASLRKECAKRGFTPPTGAKYFPGLARFRGDPEAFVSQGDGRAYIQKLCAKRGWGCEGAVNIAGRQPEKDPFADENCVPLAEDLIRNKAREMITKNPDLKRIPKRELRERVLAKHGPKR